MTAPLPASCDVAVVGAGPAGLVAAAETARRGLSTVLLDEQAVPGGQIYRAVTTTPVKQRSLLGDDFWRGAPLVEAMAASGATYVPDATVWAVTRGAGGGHKICVSRGGTAHVVHAAQVILATGALERPMPLPGWTLPGVMTAGAAQILLKTSGLVPQPPTVLAGSGPLLYLTAVQFAAAGARVACLLDTTPAGRWKDALAHAVAFLTSPYLAKGWALLRAARASTRVIAGVEAVEALGEGRLARVRYSAGGRTEEMPAAQLLLHNGVVPDVNVPLSIGCAYQWNDAQACFAVTVDAWGATSVPGIALAGDGAGIAGARAAESRGALAALHAAHALGRLDDAQRDLAAAPHRADLERWTRGREFFDALYRPAEAFRVAHGDTIVCRCEEVTARDVVEAVRQGCTGPNQVKSFLRCGMGPCQGRFCGLTVTEIIARERHVAPADVGYFRPRAPVKPVPLGELASLPTTAEATRVVVRLDSP